MSCLGIDSCASIDRFALHKPSSLKYWSTPPICQKKVGKNYKNVNKKLKLQAIKHVTLLTTRRLINLE